jgi:hypothetical protein
VNVSRVIAPIPITLSLPCGEQKDRIRHVNPWKTTLLILTILPASLALAEDFKTINGKEYKDVTVISQEPDGITVKNVKAGVNVKLFFTELPKEVQKRFNYNPEAAKRFAKEQAEIYNKTPCDRIWDNEQIAPGSYARSNHLALAYNSPERLAAEVCRAARAKMLSPEQQNAELKKIPAGGALQVWFSSLGGNWQLTYIICNSSGKVLQRKQGHLWRLDSDMEADYVELPAFDDSICVRFYHERLGNLGDYVIQRGGQVTARACQ